jgi:hypothetical protein
MAIAFASILATRAFFALSDAELVQSEIALFAMLGAFIAAIFVVYEYQQSTQAFIESQRPQLLFQLFNRFQEAPGLKEPVPLTEIQYKNITPNRFTKLSFSLIVSALGKEVDISDLLPSNMTVAGFDQRVKWFEPVRFVNEHGIFLNLTIKREPAPLLRIAYSHLFLGKPEHVELQSYRWNPLSQTWETE